MNQTLHYTVLSFCYHAILMKFTKMYVDQEIPVKDVVTTIKATLSFVCIHLLAWVYLMQKQNAH